MKVLKYPENYWTKNVSCDCGAELEINRNDIQYNKNYISVVDAYYINCIVCRNNIVFRDLPYEVKIDARFRFVEWCCENS
jgi:hypothetical protein